MSILRVILFFLVSWVSEYPACYRVDRHFYSNWAPRPLSASPASIPKPWFSMYSPPPSRSHAPPRHILWLGSHRHGFQRPPYAPSDRGFSGFLDVGFLEYAPSRSRIAAACSLCMCSIILLDGRNPSFGGCDGTPYRAEYSYSGCWFRERRWSRW
jgi:hypothetical protein